MEIPKIFNNKKLKLHKQRAVKRSGRSFLINEVSDRLIDRIADISRDFGSVLFIGDDGSEFIEKFKQIKHPKKITTAGILDKAEFIIENEILPFEKQSFDLVVSIFYMHWVNDVPGVLAQIKNILKPGGIFIAYLLGDDTLFEFKEILMEVENEISGGFSPRFSPKLDVKILGSLLQRVGFELPVSDSERIIASYDDIFGLVNDLRDMGETNSLHKNSKILNKSIIKEIDSRYKSRYSDNDGGILSSFDVVAITGLAAETNK